MLGIDISNILERDLIVIFKRLVGTVWFSIISFYIKSMKGKID